MRAKPFILILVAALLCLWMLYPTIKSRFLETDSEIETVYTYEDGSLSEIPS